MTPNHIHLSLKFLLTLSGLFIAMLWVGCDQDLTPEEQANVDQQLILDYAAAEGLNGQFDDEGIYYELTAGADTAAGFPSLTDPVVLEYQGAFLNGELFDESGAEADSVILRVTIDGWKEAIPYFNRGASGYFIVPSALAYGSTGFSVIPPNTVLRFDVSVIDF